MYGYGTDDYYSAGYGAYQAMGNFMGALGILSLVAFIAAIVFTVIFYRKYTKSGKLERISFKNDVEIGRFLRFDTLLIDKILKALYLFCALYCAFETVAVVLSLFSLGFIAFLFGLIIGAISLVISEILIRLGFENSMLRVIIARNTSAIKANMLGENLDNDGISNFTKNPPMKGNVVTPAPVPVTPAAPAEVNCPHCGAPNAAGSKFCFKCGKSLQ